MYPHKDIEPVGHSSEKLAEEGRIPAFPSSDIDNQAPSFLVKIHFQFLKCWDFVLPLAS